MSSLVDCIKNIETKYDVNQIKYDDIVLWDFIRDPLFEIWMSKKYGYSLDQGKKVKRMSLNYIKKLFRITLTTFFPLFFKKNCSILFSNYGETRIINNKIVNNITENLFLFDKNIINIWYNNTERIKKNPRYIEHEFLLYICNIFRLKYNREKMMGEKILLDILKDLDICYDYERTITSLIREICFFTKWFKMIRPICIYQICYYDLLKQSATYVAKKMGIPVIEFQHGVTNNGIGYTSFVETNRNGIPDYFFCYGEKFSESVSDTIYGRKNINLIGKYHIEEVLLNTSANKEKFLNKYKNLIKDKIVVTVAGQNTVDFALVEFVKKILNLFNNLFIIYKPRTNYVTVEMNHPRYSVETDFDIYECISQSDVCLTVYSTCAMDSLFLGTPTVLFNYNNLSKDTFATVFNGIKSVRYIEKETDFLSSVQELMSVPRMEIMKDGELFYKRNNKELLKNALKKVFSERGIENIII